MEEPTPSKSSGANASSPPNATPSPSLTQRISSKWTLFTKRNRSSSDSMFRREIWWLQRYSPRWLQPDFTWPHQVLVADKLSSDMPQVPDVTSSFRRRLIGLLHSCLFWFFEYYCAWYGYPCSYPFASLPFGLILKQADGTPLHEAQTMMAVRKAGFPCSKVISIGEHPETPWMPTSILMTSVPGKVLTPATYDSLEPAERNVIVSEIQTMIDTMRSWKNPWGQRICSISGGPIRSIRIPNIRVDPCESEAEFTAYLLSAASPHLLETQEEFDSQCKIARTLNDVEHRIVFTHGNLFTHNIFVHDGHVSNIDDWDCAGWYPEYWEFTSQLLWPTRTPERGELLMRMGGDRYRKELEAEKALRSLTISSYVGCS